MSGQKFNGWHEVGGLVLLVGMAASIGSARISGNPDAPYLFGLAVALGVVSGILVLIGCSKWDRDYVEYDEDGEPVVSTEAELAGQGKIGA